MVVKKTKSILRDFYNIYKEIKPDFGGGSFMSKTYLMAYLIDTFDLKQYVEIGVYRGKSLLPIASVVQKNNGLAIGIDPYNNECAREFDVDVEKQEAINNFINNQDFGSIYLDVLLLIEKFDLSRNCKIIRKTSSDAIIDIIKTKSKIDMLHIDGNHDYKFVKEDADKYLPLVNDWGFVIFDDIDWKSVNDVYIEVKKQGFVPILEAPTFGILVKCNNNITNLDRCRRLSKKLDFLMAKIGKIENELDNGSYDTIIPRVGIGVLAYNHELYIEECLDGIFCQKGFFKPTVYILNDKSSDYTDDFIKNYIQQNSDNLIDFEICYIENETNLGVVKSVQKLTKLLNNFDYVSICEGDDYWCDQYRVQKHIDFLKEKPECAVSFNGCNVLYQESGHMEFSEIHKTLKKDVFITEDLIDVYVIGNESCAFYDGDVINKLPENLFDLFIGDWMLNIFCSSFGDVGYIKDVMNIYRKHNGGIWSCVDINKRSYKTINDVDDYNRYTDFMFDKEFTETRNQGIMQLDGEYKENLVIIDDIFPLNLSGFRYQEFTSYLQEIEKTKILCTGLTIPQFSKETVDELIIDYKRKYPMFSGNVSKFNHWIPIDCKLMYFIFPTNAYNNLAIMEHYGIPFVYTLYPGGGFILNNKESDERLKRVMGSPCFKKVIVTQQITYDYLIENDLCDKDKIMFIFGGILPLKDINILNNYNKKYYSKGKKRLDICFMAQKYTKYGQDKGYDTFIETAKILCKKFNNIYFHVVGGFDEDTIDVSEIRQFIKFYGILNMNKLDDFFIDKDIILSPNVPNKLANGAFDGFPTGSCIEAGLRKTAILCTDMLNLNNNRIIDNEEIIIVSNNAIEIADKIVELYNKPEDLIKLCENVQKKLMYIFGYDYQIKPRIDLLREELAKPFELTNEDIIKIKNLSKVSEVNLINSKKLIMKHKLGVLYRDHCPTSIKLIYKFFKKIIKVVVRR
ncbi:MAG: class I SAM-dependent methyltransferase [Tissierellia bacterium]|nr:class I SAM-dependent methyltransferase [Tissierellia bacterium]